MFKRVACIGFLLFFLLGLASVSAEILTGTLTATTTPAAIGTGRAIKVVVQSDPDNTVDVFVGSATSQTIQLKPGQNIPLLAHPLSAIFVKTSTGTATVNYIVTRP